ncbi:hypothetical protein HOY82DRAFT_543193 [Tuber indicum]|nr:hypothetical protein HOY82DRAFT_543193 [Tuber indicum]
MNLDHILHFPISNISSKTQSSSNNMSGHGIGDGNSSQQSTEEVTPPHDKRMRGAAWQPWEDQALVRQVQEDDPILSQLGRKEDRWREVLTSLTGYGMSRSWSSCKDGMEKLVQWHKREETRSKQKTGTNEEVTDYIERLDDITLRYESLSKNSKIKQQAKMTIEKKREYGKKLRESSLAGVVKKCSLESHQMESSCDQHRTDIDEATSLTHPRKRTKQAKNLFAKEVAGVVDGIHEKASELRKKIEQKEEQERESMAEQREFGRKMVLLIQSNQQTNESIQMLLQTLVS